MEPQDMLHGLIHLWDDLPGLAGPSWPDLLEQLKVLFDRFQEADGDERIFLTSDVVNLCAVHEPLRQALFAKIEEIGYQERGRTGQEDPPSPEWHDWNRLSDGLREIYRSPSTVRQANIYAPEQVTPQAEFSISIGLEAMFDEAATASLPFEGFPGQSLEVCLRVNEEAFEVLKPGKTLKLPFSEEEIELRSFRLKALKPGRNKCWLEFRQDQQRRAMISLDIEAVDVVSERAPIVRSAPMSLGGETTAAADVTITLVDTGKHSLSLDFSSTSHRAFFGKKFFHIEWSGDLAGDIQDWVDRMTQLDFGSKGNGVARSFQQEEDALDQLGRKLFDCFFGTPELRRQYKALCQAGSAQVFTFDPRIPFELIKPSFDRSSENLEDLDEDFLCLHLPITRWLTGIEGPSSEITVGAYALAAATYEEKWRALEQAAAEVKALAPLFEVVIGPEKNRMGELVTVDHILEVMAHEEIGLWHLSAHGAEDRLLLAAKSELRSDDLSPDQQHNLSRIRPLIFLNGCRTASVKPEGSGLTGWVPALLGKSGCGSFVGTLWKVSDDVGRAFAEAFYRVLLGNKHEDRQRPGIGEATLAARRAAWRLAKEKPVPDFSWAAYCVYAHPNTRLVPEHSDPELE